jgi:hypothetical protein
MVPSPAIPLPLPVQALLRQLAGRVRLACLVRLASVAWLSLVVAWLALYLGDRYGDSPSWLRVGLCATMAVVWLTAGGLALHGWARAASAAACARRVIAVNPRFGHLLLSAVELAADTPPPEAASRALVQTALQQVAAACADESATRYVRVRPAGLLLAALAFGTAALIPAALSTPDALPRGFARLLCPLAPLPRATRIRLTGTPDRLVVPWGEPSLLRLAVAARRGPLPAELSWRLGRVAAGRAPVGRDGSCRVQLPAVERPETLRLRGGDAVAAVSLLPLPTPALTRLDAIVGETAVRPGTRLALLPGTPRLTVPVGTRVRLEGWVDRPLAELGIGRVGGGASPLEEARFAGDRFFADLGPLVASTELRLAWASTDGLWTAAPYHLRLEAVPAAPPRLRWSGTGVPARALPDALLTVAVDAADDTGLARLELQAGTPPGRTLSRRADCTAAPRQAMLSLTVCPADLGLAAGQTLHVEAVAAADVAGQPPARLSLEIAISAAGPWVEDLSGRLRRAWRCLEQIAATEAHQADSEQAALTASPPEVATVQAAAIQATETDAGLAREVGLDIDRLIAAALACEELDAAVPAAWAETRRALAIVVEQSFPALLAELRRAEAQPAACLAAALPRRRDLVQALQAILAADDHFRRCAVRTAALRLLEAARAEQALAAELGSLPAAWAGKSRADLDPAAGTQLDALARRQEAVATDLGRLGALLHDLAARGAPGAYAAVAEALDAAGLVPDLEHAAAQLRRNHRFFALGAADAAAVKLAEWAAALDAGARAETGTAGGGQGGAPGGVGEVTLRLRRALMAQEGLRERTRLVELITQSPLLQQDMSANLALRQADLAAAMPDVGRLCPGPLMPLIDQGTAAMRAAAAHLRAVRLEPALEAQAAASEWLTACLQQSRDLQAAGTGGTAAAQAGAASLGLGQTGTRSGAEAPLDPASAAATPGAAWAAHNPSRGGNLIRAGSPAEVPAAYRLLWEQYRRRLQEIRREP